MGIALALALPSAVWGAPLLADVRAQVGSNGVSLCDQSVANGVLPPAVVVSCSGLTQEGVHAVINSIGNPDGTISFGGSLSAPPSKGVSVGGKVKIKGDAVEIKHELVSGGFLQISGRPSGVARFMCPIGCSGFATFETNIEIAGVESSLVDDIFSVQGTSDHYPTSLAAVRVPFTVGVKLPVEFSFTVGFSVINSPCMKLSCDFSDWMTGTFTLADPPLIEVLDSNLQPLANALLTSDSGINYGSAAVEPVPEPASLALVGAGLAACALRRRRRCD